MTQAYDISDIEEDVDETEFSYDPDAMILAEAFY